MSDEDRRLEDGAETAMADAEAAAPFGAEPEAGPPPKRCVCCGALIPRPALNCSQCRSWVALWEGSVAKEYFYLLAAAFLCLLGTLLPWQRLPIAATPGVAAEVTGVHFMSGAVIFFFSLVAMLACLYNIRAKRLLFWPILLLLVVNLFTIAVHFLMAANQEAIRQALETPGDIRERAWALYRTQGIGFYFAMVGTLWILLQIVVSVFKAAGKNAGKKPAPARGGRRR